MPIDFDGKSIETTENGYLLNVEDWSPGLAEKMASDEGLQLTDKHMDIINPGSLTGGMTVEIIYGMNILTMAATSPIREQ